MILTSTVDCGDCSRFSLRRIDLSTWKKIVLQTILCNDDDAFFYGTLFGALPLCLMVIVQMLITEDNSHVAHYYWSFL